ncbi:hypothetical protein GQ42DRAFT_152425 [Ramicandelaber brevisporus]|nr:hypothetical protein GQ42DRAFT_152425 [Ramicandelaber brevisporus]
MLSERDLTPTPAAITTTLDSLRDKIRGFVDIASEDQLREVSRLIDRLSISNKAPFRLGDLPFDLLEYTAQNFFTPKEAAPLMRTSSALGEFFANVVWKYIYMNGTKISGKDVSSHALIRNARRIRHVDLTDTPPDLFVSLHFPNATWIAFDLDKSFENMFTLHLSQLLNLRHVMITVLEKSDDSIIAIAVKWINHIRNSRHVKTISFEIDDASDNQQLASRNLVTLLGQISNKSRIRVQWISLNKLSDVIIPFMPSMLTFLDMSQSVPDRCIAVPKTACGGHEKSPLPTIFSKKWSNL